MVKLFFCTNNKGKQKEIEEFVRLFDVKNIDLYFPDDTNSINVEETGNTYEENARLKADAYYKHIGDDSMTYIGDDSGLCIPVLNNQPGVRSRRWAGYEMTDQEILDYCIEMMKPYKGSKRNAYFETVLIAFNPKSNTYRKFTGKLDGHILEKPTKISELNGLPLRNLLWIDNLKLVWDDAVKLSYTERNGFLTNREAAFKELLNKTH